MCAREDVSEVAPGCKTKCSAVASATSAATQETQAASQIGTWPETRDTSASGLMVCKDGHRRGGHGRTWLQREHILLLLKTTACHATMGMEWPRVGESRVTRGRPATL